jgi:nucleoside-diphosphate-sugar epimerase
MVPNLRRVLDAPDIEGITIHPAMVYEPGGAVFRSFPRDARERDAIRVVGNEAVRWPLVHSEDLATLYAMALENAPARSSYIGASIEGLAVGRIARAFAKRFGTRYQEPEIISEVAAAELGDWAKGFALDQQCAAPRRGVNSPGCQSISIRSTRSRRLKTEKARHMRGPSFSFATLELSGAGEGIRTLDPDLGKVVLYH